MRLLHLDLLRHGDMVLALAVVMDGYNPVTFRSLGEDGVATIDEAARVTRELIDRLGSLEIDVPCDVQQSAFRVCGQPEKWRTV